MTPFVNVEGAFREDLAYWTDLGYPKIPLHPHWTMMSLASTNS